MREKFNPFSKSSSIRTNPAAKTKSIEFQADTQLSSFSHPTPGQLYRDMTDSARLSGPSHLDSFIVTPNLRPPIGTGFAKTHANPDTPRYRSGQAHGNSLLFGCAHNPPGC